LKPIAVIDLYAGLGGFTQGAIEAGAEVILSIDFWDEAIKVHKVNHPSIPCWQMKLGSPTDYKIINQVIEKYRKTHHIHIHGSPPCQALSNASRRDAGEGMPLIIHYLELIELLKPDSWSMENVVPMRKRLPEGTPSVVLNSADFGVPQTRRRCIAGEGWIAQPTHTKDEWVSVIQALPHLEGELLMDSGRANAKTTGINPRTGKKEGGSGALFRSLDKPSYTIMSSPRTICVNTSGGGSSNGRRVNSVDSDIYIPSKTIHNNTPSLRLTDNKPEKIRSLTLEETLTLQGFSPEYDLSSTRLKKDKWTMIGNAVCPAVAKAIIEGIES
jgi:site-specific DNA-cytosine methylase